MGTPPRPRAILSGGQYAPKFRRKQIARGLRPARDDKSKTIGRATEEIVSRRCRRYAAPVPRLSLPGACAPGSNLAAAARLGWRYPKPLRRGPEDLRFRVARRTEGMGFVLCNPALFPNQLRNCHRNSFVVRTLPTTPSLSGLCGQGRKLLKMRQLHKQRTPIIPRLYSQSPANTDFTKAIIFLYEETFHAICNL